TLAICVVATSFSNAWILSVVTVLSVIVSSFVFRYYVVDPQMKLISKAFNFALSWPAFVVRIFLIDQWFEFKKEDSKKTLVTIFSYILLHFCILSVFFGLYILSSVMFSKWYNCDELNIDGTIIFTIIFGFYISFVFRHIKVSDFIKLIDKSLKFILT